MLLKRSLKIISLCSVLSTYSFALTCSVELTNYLIIESGSTGIQAGSFSLEGNSTTTLSIEPGKDFVDVPERDDDSARKAGSSKNYTRIPTFTLSKIKSNQSKATVIISMPDLNSILDAKDIGLAVEGNKDLKVRSISEFDETNGTKVTYTRDFGLNLAENNETAVTVTCKP